jgi:hypothetical protein
MSTAHITITANWSQITVTIVSSPHRGHGKGHKYPPEQVEFIRDNFAGYSIAELTILFNRRFGTAFTTEQIRNAAKIRGLSTGNDGRFKPGQIPHNKGKKKWWTGGEETRFKKDHMPFNYRPVGSERVNVEGYIEIKVADPKTWKLKHRLIWEAAHGLIPRGHRVVFGDGDKANLSLDNLILVTLEQAAVMSKLGLFQFDADLTRIGVTIADLKMKITEREKGRKKAGGETD